VGARPDDFRDTVNSRQKGKRVERLWRDQLREAGFLKAFRGQQYCGAAGDADVVCPELPTIHFEVKGVQNLNVLAAMKQAIADSAKSGRTPTVAHKKNGEPWLVTMLAADWLRLVRDSDWVSPTEDPQTSPATTSSVNYDVVPPRSPRLVDCPMTSSNSSSPASEHR
jgi:Holliday junction resolvase